MNSAKILIENFKLKKPLRFKNNIFILYSLKKQTIETANTLAVDTEVSVSLPENTNAFLATKFEGQEIQKIIGPTNGKKRLWITLLNESYFEPQIIEKGGVLGYLIIEPEDSEVKICDASKKNARQKKPQPNNYLPKEWNKKWKKYFEKKKITSLDRWVFKQV